MSKIPVLGKVLEDRKFGTQPRRVALGARIHSSVLERIKGDDKYTPAAHLEAGAWRPLPPSVVQEQEPWD
jgi:hypothetical protein